ncbi:Rieske (2Fe-2S) protein [Thiohalomonas denitrificans]|uniref:Ubiquinol-cytochrome c reductase iron-sulfur subunit n=1 Tax=Thiohalomonas denitrificans TaxID=415747 RepID=A0A1G5PYF4_9GAMM|nr:hypothetical protein [Thiohalomonas denitrificans]SCZ54645.1 ubiquinol-cytochrome c reductase iron-sulfur subunit [Thiohalomonas denitrificans]
MSEPRRRFLATVVKSMALFAVVMFSLALFGSLPSNPGGDIRPGLKLAVGDMLPGEFRRADWQGRPLVVLRRTPAMLAALADTRDLRDPDSNASRQPPAARNPGRSLRPELFVAYGFGTSSGCPVDFVPAAESVGMEGWSGGFRDRCDGSLYDTAGRIYRNQPASKNLVVPSYREAGTGHIELENRD